MTVVILTLTYERIFCDHIYKINDSRQENNNQWHSQTDSLVPLCKFQVIIIFHFFGN